MPRSGDFPNRGTPAESTDTIVATMDTISNIRRTILAHDVDIVGYRITFSTGRGYVLRKFFSSPTRNSGSNLPVDAALCEVSSTAPGSVKRFWLHDLPDDYVMNGAIVRDNVAQINSVIKAYCDNGFQIRYQDQLAASANILSITAAGLVTTRQAIALVEGQQVDLLHVRDINRKAIHGRYSVGHVTDAQHFLLNSWPGNTVAEVGKVRLTSFLFSNAAVFGR